MTKQQAIKELRTLTTGIYQMMRDNEPFREVDAALDTVLTLRDKLLDRNPHYVRDGDYQLFDVFEDVSYAVMAFCRYYPESYVLRVPNAIADTLRDKAERGYDELNKQGIVILGSDDDTVVSETPALTPKLTSRYARETAEQQFKDIRDVAITLARVALGLPCLPYKAKECGCGNYPDDCTDCTSDGWLPSCGTCLGDGSLSEFQECDTCKGTGLETPEFY